jgi:putative polyhydroxyalkanoate system protein
MSQAITITIPHQLSRAEAKRRVQEEISRALPQLGSLVTLIKQEWAGDTLDLSVSAAGHVISGRVFVEDRQVRVEVSLPWFLAALAGVVRQGIEQRGRQLLGHDPGARPSSR